MTQQDRAALFARIADLDAEVRRYRRLGTHVLADRLEEEVVRLKGTVPRREPVTGVCCACGYDGEVETDCPEREDGQHCMHWYDGPEDDASGLASTRLEGRGE
jgi:hypothetical protein